MIKESKYASTECVKRVDEMEVGGGNDNGTMHIKYAWEYNQLKIWQERESSSSSTSSNSKISMWTPNVRHHPGMRYAQTNKYIHIRIHIKAHTHTHTLSDIVCMRGYVMGNMATAAAISVGICAKSDRHTYRVMIDSKINCKLVNDNYQLANAHFNPTQRALVQSDVDSVSQHCPFDDECLFIDFNSKILWFSK